ncbi:MAG: hypothetical protein ACLFTA_02315 [Candidatus Nanohaloarchaea archaeon]
MDTERNGQNSYTDRNPNAAIGFESPRALYEELPEDVAEAFETYALEKDYNIASVESDGEAGKVVLASSEPWRVMVEFMENGSGLGLDSEDLGVKVLRSPASGKPGNLQNKVENDLERIYSEVAQEYPEPILAED